MHYLLKYSLKTSSLRQIFFFFGRAYYVIHHHLLECDVCEGMIH